MGVNPVDEDKSEVSLFFLSVFAFNINGGSFAAERIYETVAGDFEFSQVFWLDWRERDEKIFYGADLLQFGELWLPGSALPLKGLIAFVHGGWPGTHEDIQAGLSHIDELIRFGVSIENVVLTGHSAGGYLALLAGSYKDDAILKLNAVVDLGAITNQVSCADGNNSCEVATPMFIGGS